MLITVLVKNFGTLALFSQVFLQFQAGTDNTVSMVHGKLSGASDDFGTQAAESILFLLAHFLEQANDTSVSPRSSSSRKPKTRVS